MDLYAKLASNMEELAGTFDAKLHNMEADIKRLTSTEVRAPQTPHKDLETLSREFYDFKTFIWKSMAMMRSQLELLVQGMDRQETASRRKILLFHGIPESSEVTADKSILKMLADQFQLPDIVPDQLSTCHRLGTNTSKPRPIMVRFANYTLRAQIWNAKTSLKGTDISVSEFLTKSRHDMFLAARRHFGVRRCWTSEGKIMILLPNNKRHKIEAMSELKPLLAEFPSPQSTQEKASSSSVDKGKPSSAPVVKAGSSRTQSRTRRAPK